LRTILSLNILTQAGSPPSFTLMEKHNAVPAEPDGIGDVVRVIMGEAILKVMPVIAVKVASSIANSGLIIFIEPPTSDIVGLASSKAWAVIVGPGGVVPITKVPISIVSAGHAPSLMKCCADNLVLTQINKRMARKHPIILVRRKDCFFFML
jgi:hypothetical protein